PVFKAARADAPEDLVELFVADQKRVMLGGNLAIGLMEVERDAVAERYHEKRSKACRCRQAEDAGKERRQPLLVAAPDKRVIELHAHIMILVARSPAYPSSDPSVPNRVPDIGTPDADVLQQIIGQLHEDALVAAGDPHLCSGDERRLQRRRDMAVDVAKRSAGGT